MLALSFRHRKSLCLMSVVLDDAKYFVLWLSLHISMEPSFTNDCYYLDQQEIIIADGDIRCT